MNETQQFIDNLRGFMNSFMFGVNTAIPGKILTVDSFNKISVEPLVMGINPVNNEPEKIPTLVDIPVIFPQGRDSGISWKLEKGDFVLVVFSKFSIDEWVQGDGKVKPQSDPKQFDLSDGMAIPGLFPFNNSTPETDGLLVRHKETTIEITEDSVKIGGEGAKKLINENFKSMFDSHTHPYLDTIGQPTVPTPSLTGSPSSTPLPVLTPIQITDNEMTSVLESK